MFLTVMIDCSVIVVFLSEMLRRSFLLQHNMATSRWRQRLVRVECGRGSGCRSRILLERYVASLLC